MKLDIIFYPSETIVYTSVVLLLSVSTWEACREGRAETKQSLVQRSSYTCRNVARHWLQRSLLQTVWNGVCCSWFAVSLSMSSWLLWSLWMSVMCRDQPNLWENDLQFHGGFLKNMPHFTESSQRVFTKFSFRVMWADRRTDKQMDILMTILCTPPGS